MNPEKLTRRDLLRYAGEFAGKWPIWGGVIGGIVFRLLSPTATNETPFTFGVNGIKLYFEPTKFVDEWQQQRYIVADYLIANGLIIDTIYAERNFGTIEPADSHYLTNDSYYLIGGGKLEPKISARRIEVENYIKLSSGNGVYEFVALPQQYLSPEDFITVGGYAWIVGFAYRATIRHNPAHHLNKDFPQGEYTILGIPGLINLDDITWPNPNADFFRVISLIKQPLRIVRINPKTKVVTYNDFDLGQWKIPKAALGY